MKNWIALLAILLVALAPIAIADDGSDHDSDSGAADTADSEETDSDDSAESGEATDDDSAEEGRKGKSNREERQEKREEKHEERQEKREEKREARTEKKEEIRALREKIKTACEDKQSQECKDARMEARGAKHDILGRIAGKMGPVFKRADMLIQKLDRIVAHLEKKGKDTSGLDTGAIDAKITEAKSLFDEGKALFEQARSAEPGQKDEFMKQAAQKFRAANAALKDARTLIRDWLKSVRGKDPAAVDESTPTDASAPAEPEASPAPTETEASPAPEDSDADDAEDDSDEEDSDDADEDESDDDSDEEDSDDEDDADETAASPTPTA